MTPPWSGDYTTNGNLPVVVSHYLQANTGVDVAFVRQAGSIYGGF